MVAGDSIPGIHRPPLSTHPDGVPDASTLPIYNRSARVLLTMTIRKRIENLDWQSIEQSLWDRGYAKTSPLLTPEECNKLIALYRQEEKFRSRTDMARYRFGVGEYKYFADPLPPLVQQLREQMYPLLAPIANRWMDALRIPEQFPTTLTEFLSYSTVVFWLSSGLENRSFDIVKKVSPWNR